jgi:branched-chain amino acid transport system ATP-binding protein
MTPAGSEERASTPGRAVLVAQGVTAGYGKQPVIREIDIEVRSGQVVAILGANGAGKSTTLLALAGVLPLMEGSVVFAGRKTKVPLHKRARQGLAFVPEERSIFKSLSCRDNLRVGYSDSAAALELFPELGKRLNVRAGLLSGGEQQMLALARVLSRTPQVLLVDELSLGLAPMIVKVLMRAVREAADRGSGVVLVEQHVRQALGVADYAHVLRRGQIVLSGPADEMLERISDVENSYL